MHRRRNRFPVRLACALAVLGFATPAIAAAATITLDGATASYPLLELLTAKYVQVTHKRVHFKLSESSSGIGITEVTQGRVDIADSSRPPAAGDRSSLNFYPVAKYFVCIVTNSSNPISNLSATQVQQIFSGKVRDWSQVSGSSAHGTIDLYTRQSTAGVLTTFQTTLLGGGKVSSVATPQASEGLMQTAVKNDKNAIGFLTDFYALKKVHAVGYDGVACNVANTVSNSYAGVGRFYEVTNGRAKGASLAFIKWVQQSAAAKRLIETSWVPLNP